jgi:hypothetical protein
MRSDHLRGLSDHSSPTANILVLPMPKLSLGRKKNRTSFPISCLTRSSFRDAHSDPLSKLDCCVSVDYSFAIGLDLVPVGSLLPSFCPLGIEWATLH